MRVSPATEELFDHKVNLKARRAHRRDTLLQIVLPLLVAAALGVWAILALTGGNTTGQAAQLATILLALPLFLFGILFFFAIIFFIFTLGRLMGWIPTQTVRVQRAVERISQLTIRSAELAARPLVAIDAWANTLGRLFRRELP